MQRRTRLIGHGALAWAVMVLLGATGCGSLDADNASGGPGLVRASDHTKTLAPPAPDRNIIDIPDELEPVDNPIDAYELAPRQEAVLEYAAQVMGAQCMKKRGFDWPVLKFEDLANWWAADGAEVRSKYYGLVDRGAASTYGYGEPPQVPFPEFPYDKIYREQPGAEGAWEGSGSGPASADADSAGCRDETAMSLFDQSEAELSKQLLGHSLAVQAADRAMGRADYLAVQADLGQCLRDRGYDVPNPEKPYSSKAMKKISGGAYKRDPGTPASKDEINLALTDIDCKIQTDYVQRRAAIDAEEERKLIEANALALEEEQKRIKASLKRAADVMAGKGVQ